MQKFDDEIWAEVCADTSRAFGVEVKPEEIPDCAVYCWGVHCAACGYLKAYPYEDSHWCAEQSKRDHVCPQGGKAQSRRVKIMPDGSKVLA